MKILKNLLNYELPIRTQLDFPIEGIEFIDITPLLMDSKIYNDIINTFVHELKNKQIDYIVSPEARGFLFGCSVSQKINCGFIPSRKLNKLPPNFIEINFSYDKEYGRDSMCLPKLYNDTYTNKNFYILDDIYATGNTVEALKSSILAIGGNVLGTGVLLNIAELNSNKELFSIIDINEN